MSDGSKIEWTDATWNPVAGCSRVSEGCRNCYAEAMAARFNQPGQWGHGLAEHVTRPDGSREARWTGKVALLEHKLDQPLRWRRPRRIFVNATSDLFHEAVPDAFIDRVFAVMALASQHDFQVLTKRPDRMREYFAAPNTWGRIVAASDELKPSALWNGNAYQLGYEITTHGFLPNCWLGVSVEDQATADARIPLLLATPAAVRFISAEPLLGPVNLRRVVTCKGGISTPSDRLNALTGVETRFWGEGGSMSECKEGAHLDWVIVGGESGPGARPTHPDWVRSLRDQCAAAGVAFFFKQWGEWSCNDQIGDDHPRLIRVQHDVVFRDRLHRACAMGGVAFGRVGKKAAGRLLDGMLHDAMPGERA